MIPARESIDQIRQKFRTPRELLVGAGVRVKGKRFWCPFEHASGRPDKHASGQLYSRAGVERWRCWSCDRRGDAVDLAGELGLEIPTPASTVELEIELAKMRHAIWPWREHTGGAVFSVLIDKAEEHGTPKVRYSVRDLGAQAVVSKSAASNYLKAFERAGMAVVEQPKKTRMPATITLATCANWKWTRSYLGPLPDSKDQNQELTQVFGLPRRKHDDLWRKRQRSRHGQQREIYRAFRQRAQQEGEPMAARSTVRPSRIEHEARLGRHCSACTWRWGCTAECVAQTLAETKHLPGRPPAERCRETA